MGQCAKLSSFCMHSYPMLSSVRLDHPKHSFRQTRTAQWPMKLLSCSICLVTFRPSQTEIVGFCKHSCYCGCGKKDRSKFLLMQTARASLERTTCQLGLFPRLADPRSRQRERLLSHMRGAGLRSEVLDVASQLSASAVRICFS